MKITLEKETDYKGDIWYVLTVDGKREVFFSDQNKAIKRFEELKTNGLEPTVLLGVFETPT